MAIASPDFRELRLERISRDFGQVHALRDVSLTMRRGEFVALLGPSGCGKSTALNCIAGLLQVTAGAIWLDERRLDEVGPEDRGFGMVFQNYALFPHMTVRRNVGFGLVTQRRPKAEIDRRVDQALALVRLESHADKLPGQLSGGQQQRVAIARAIVVEPPLVLMDEPLSNLDAKLRLEMRAEVRRIHTMLGCSTIYVTHDQEEALSLADRILVMIDGQTRQIGTPEDLYSRPAHADVAEFMGYRNLVNSAAENSDAGVAITIGGARVIGRPMEPLAERAIVAIRPDDLRPTADGPITATVEIAEYHGRDFYAVAKGIDGTDLYFRSDRRVASGEVVRLAAPAARILVYPA
ncbi:MAG TPA: ABC transporter ATP-binding protein [Acetobacteraceae bacterium]|jgi:putative spermidine/putrescine transport system ATP-binding protein